MNSIVTLVAVGATPPCVQCGSSEACDCDLAALCASSAARFQADSGAPRLRDGDFAALAEIQELTVTPEVLMVRIDARKIAEGIAEWEPAPYEPDHLPPHGISRPSRVGAR